MQTLAVILLGIILLSSVPLSLLYALSVAYRSPQSFQRALPFFISAFAVMAYCCMPTYENDLMRYFHILDQCKAVPWDQAATWADDGLVVKNLLFWLISRTGDNHLLPALTTGTLYGVSAYICSDSLRESTWLFPVLIFQTLALPFFLIVSNVRNVFAFSLITLAVYRDVNQKKLDLLTLLLYTAPCFIHMTGFVLLLLRLSLLLMDKYPRLGIISSVAVPSLTIASYRSLRGIISLIPGNVGKIVNRALLKAYTATMSTSDYAQSVHSSGYFNACRLIMAAMAVLIIYLGLRSGLNKKERTGFLTYSLLIASITGVWAVLGIVKYWVFAVFAVVTAPSVLKHISASNRIPMKRECLVLLALLSIVRFALEVYYIRTRIDTTAFFLGIMTTSAFTVLIKDCLPISIE